MQNKYLVSVIIPVFNTDAKLLTRSIESVQNQSLKGIQIIIVDDGSTKEDTLRTLLQFEKEGFLVLHIENGGQARARNIGFQYAEGDFIGYIDSDDWIDTDFYEVLYNKCEDDDSDMACGALMFEYSDHQRMISHTYNCTETILKDKLDKLYDGSCCTKIFRKDIIKDVKFPEGYIWEDNVVLAHMVVNSKRISYTSKTKYHYFQHDNSTVHHLFSDHRRQTDAFVVLSYIKSMAEEMSKYEGQLLIDRFYRFIVDKDVYANDVFYRRSMDAMLGDYCTRAKQLSFFEKIFSVVRCRDRRYKQLTIFGISFVIPA